MTSYKILRLTDAARPLILAHHLELDEQSRYSRFHTGANDSFIARYVDSLDLQKSSAFGVNFPFESKLAGFIHMAHLDASRVEIGVSVLSPYRRQGIARTLVEHCEEAAYQRAYAYLEMYCLVDNQGLRAIARGLGMALTIEEGEARAIATLRRSVLAHRPNLSAFLDSTALTPPLV